jgi:hypothetical protein
MTKINIINPFRIYRITDPCKKCIVKPMCSKVCNEYIKRLNFGETMNYYKERIFLIIKTICEKIYLFFAFLLYASVFLIITILIYILIILFGVGFIYTLNEIVLLWGRILT